VTSAELPAYLTNQIAQWKSDGGAEWGWEFTFHWDDVEVKAMVELQKKEAGRATEAEHAAQEAQVAGGAQAKAAALLAVGQFAEAMRSAESVEERQSAALQMMGQLNPQMMNEAMPRKAQGFPCEGPEPPA